MLRWTVLSTLVALFSLVTAQRAAAHCQVPCGIYDDHNRVHQMREDVVTIRKAVAQIRALSRKRDALSANQLARWVMTKEQHAEKIIRVVSDYFMTQKITPAKPGDKRAWKAYVETLARHHAVMKAAMRCKQTVDDQATIALGKALDGIERYWPKK